MLAFLFSLWVNTAYFLADVFVKYSSLKLSTGRLIYVRSILTFLLATVWLFISGDYSSIPQGVNVAMLLFCSVLCALGLYFYIQALKHMHFVNVSVIGICGALIHYVLGILLFQEKSSPWFFLAAILSVSGIIIQWRKTQSRKGMKEAIISAILWGFGYALLSLPMNNTSPAWGTWIMEITTLIMALIFVWQTDRGFAFVKESLRLKAIWGIAFFTILGSVMINYCYQQFNLNVLGFMQLAFFPYSLLAGYFLFHEKLNKWEWVGNSMVIAGLCVYFYGCT